MIINKAEYSALDASRRRLREGVTDRWTDRQTDGRTDRRTDTTSYIDATAHVKRRLNACIELKPSNGKISSKTV